MTNNRNTRSFTPPIRSLKPSRSSGIISHNHNNTKATNSRTSLPALDLGIPVVGLGPPAPPPSAPLPNLPPAGERYSRAPSPLPPSDEILERGREGLGIRVGE
jgi:hypothetical protein